MDALTAQRRLKEKIRRTEPTLGIFVRTPATQVVESLGQSGVDFIVLDAEHAPFGISELDRCILAGRSVGTPVLVRLGDQRAASILQVLDMGAAGIVVPHVGSAKTAETVIRACRYNNGRRGFSGQHRAADYGSIPGVQYRRDSDESVIVVAQIEDSSGHANIDEIVAVSELDAVFIGRADLAVSMGCDNPDDAAVVAATDTILTAARQFETTAGIFLPTIDDTEEFRNQGVSLFVIATDQSLLIDAARRITTQFNGTAG